MESKQGECPQCGAALGEKLPGGQMCPKCLLYAAIHDTRHPKSDPGAPGKPEGSAPELLPPPGTPRYEPGEQIARGGMGKILSAREVPVGRNVAMKVILDDDQDGDWMRLRFVEEAKITGMLEHPSIVPMHDLDLDEKGNVFYTMKLVQGRTLAEILDRMVAGDRETLSEFPLVRFLTVFQKICDAIAFAHSRGVIHRDLKPANIMVGGYGEVLVMDWGLAKVLDMPELENTLQEHQSETAREGTTAGTIMGTIGYMPPEQAGSGDPVGPRSDIYALGAILYQILTLRKTVQAETVSEALDRICEGKIELPGIAAAGHGKPLPHWPGNRVPRSLAAVAMKALAKDPLDRYATVPELQAEIEAYQGGFATEAEEASFGKHLKLFVRRHKTESVAAGLILALLVAGLVVSDELRRRAVAAEKNAIAAEQKATAAKFQSERRLATSCLERGWNLHDAEDRGGALLWHARAFEILHAQSDDPDTDPGLDDDRLRLATVQEGILRHRLLGWGIARMDYSPDGRWLAVARVEGHKIETLLIDCETLEVKHRLPPADKNPHPKVAFLPDGRHLVTAGNTYSATQPGGLHLWDLQAVATSTGAPEPVRSIATSSGEIRDLQIAGAAEGIVAILFGGQALQGRDRIQVWDALKGELLFEKRDLDQGPGWISIDPAGERLCWSEANNRGAQGPRILYDIAGQSILATLPDSRGSAPAWAPDGGWVAHAEADGVARIHRDGRIERPWIAQRLDIPIRTTIDAAGRRLSVDQFSLGARVFDLGQDPPVQEARFDEPIGEGESRSFLGPEGSRILLLRASGAAALGRVDGKTFPGGVIRIMPVSPNGIAFSPDASAAAFTIHAGGHYFGRILAADARHARAYDVLGRGAGALIPFRGEPGIGFLGTTQHRLAAFDLRTGKVTAEGVRNHDAIQIRTDPNNRFLSIFRGRRNPPIVEVIDLQHPDRESIRVELPGMEAWPVTWRSHAASPDGSSLAVGIPRAGGGTEMCVYDLAQPDRPPRKLGNSGLRYGGRLVNWSPDGTLVSSVDGNHAAVWNVQSGQSATLENTHQVWGMHGAQFSQDGGRLAAGGLLARIEVDPSGAIRLDEESRAELPAGVTVSDALWDETTNRSAIGLSSGQALVWDHDRGVPAGPILRTRHQGVRAAPGRKGAWIATSTASPHSNRRANHWRLWEVESGLPITPRMELGDDRLTGYGLGILDDEAGNAELLVSLGLDGAAAWKIRGDDVQWPLNPEETMHLAQLHAYRRIDDNSLLVDLDQEEWDRLWLAANERVRDRFMRGGLVLGAPQVKGTEAGPAPSP